MAFPTTGLLADFNQADGALDASWTIAFGNGWSIFSNEAGPFTGVSVHASSWGEQLNADQEVWADLREPAAAGSFIALYARMQVENDFTSDHYRLHIVAVSGSNNDLLRIIKRASDVETQLGADMALNDDHNLEDQYGLAPIDDEITAYRNSIEVGSRIDGDIAGAGFIGMVNGANAGVPRWNDFGGGHAATVPVSQTLILHSEARGRSTSTAVLPVEARGPVPVPGIQVKWASILGALQMAIAGADAPPTLKNLANGSAKIGNPIVGNRHQWSAWELRVRFEVAPTIQNGYLDVFFLKALDGDNFEDFNDAAVSAFSFPVRTVTTQQRITIDRVPLPPLDFAPLIVNHSGQALTNVDDENELRYRGYNDEVQ